MDVLKFMYNEIIKMVFRVFRRYLHLFFLILIIVCIYYKFFILGLIPFPADLLVNAYSPWFDYYKFPVQNPLISDVFSQFFLWKNLSIEVLKNLEWPLWNPYSFTGTPLLATYHSATLYPLNILLVLPNHIGWGGFIFSSTLLASLNMYLLLAYWLKPKLPVILGALIYSISGLMTTWTEFGTAVHAMAWLPLSIYALEKYINETKIRYLVLLSLSLVLIILVGNAQITTYSFILIVIFSLFRFSGKKFTRKLIIKVFLIFFAIFISIGITMPQLLPSFDLLKKSIRAAGDTYTESYNFGLLPVREVLKFFAADFFGNPTTRNYWGFLNYSETSGFLGTLTLPLLIFSLLFLKKNKTIYFFFGVFAFSLIMVFDNPLSQLIYKSNIPLLTLSFASRMLFLTTLAASIICAFSLNQIIMGKNQLNNLFKSSLWSLAAILGIFFGTYLISKIIETITQQAQNDLIRNLYLTDQQYQLSNFSIALKNLIPPFVITFFYTVFLIFTIKFIKYQQILIISLLLILLISADLGRYFLKFNPFTKSEHIFPTTPSIEFLQTRPGIFRVGREHAEVLPPNTWTTYNLQSFEGYDPIYLYNYSAFIHFLNGGKISSGSSGRYAELSSTYQSPYLDAANVKYFIAILRDQNGQLGGDQVNFKFNEAKYPIIYKDKTSAILENPNSLDRVYFAKSVNVVTEQKIKLAIDNDNLNPRETVMLSKNLNIANPTSRGEAKILNYGTNSVSIQTSTDQEEILVLADQYEEGWHAKIDNQEVAVSPANLIFRAIKVPAGKHQIKFYYWPKSFEIGLKIAGASLLLLFALILISLKRRVF